MSDKETASTEVPMPSPESAVPNTDLSFDEGPSSTGPSSMDKGKDKAQWQETCIGFWSQSGIRQREGLPGICKGISIVTTKNDEDFDGNEASLTTGLRVVITTVDPDEQDHDMKGNSRHNTAAQSRATTTQATAGSVPPSTSTSTSDHEPTPATGTLSGARPGLFTFLFREVRDFATNDQKRAEFLEHAGQTIEKEKVLIGRIWGNIVSMKALNQTATFMSQVAQKSINDIKSKFGGGEDAGDKKSGSSGGVPPTGSGRN
eukprot:Clim_evm58s156 gene=Clim_evmTU58s156